MPCRTLGELLQLLDDLLPNEVELCISTLALLRQSEGLKALGLGEEGGEVIDSLVELKEKRSTISGITDLGEVPDTPLLPQSANFPPPPPSVVHDAFMTPTIQSLHLEEAPPPGCVNGNVDGNGLSEHIATNGKGLHHIMETLSEPSLATAASPTRSAADDNRAGAWHSRWFPAPSTGNLRARLFVMFDDGGQSRLSMAIAVLLMVAIGVSTVSFVLESMPEFRSTPDACFREKTVLNCEPVPDESFFYVEAVCIFVFTVDYVVRISTVHALPSSAPRRLLATWKYFKLPLNMIDLIAILPFYVNLVVGNVGPVRVLRLARILRLFKAAKHHPGMMMLAEVMVMSGLPLLILMFFNIILTVLFAALIYFAEGLRYSVAPEFTAPGGACGDEACHPYGTYVRQAASLEEDEVSPFRSIPYGCWWVVTTMTTVGYGDFTPTTRIGKTIGVIVFYVGVIFLALPISVIVTNFEIVYNRHMAKKTQVRRTLKKRTSMMFSELAWFPEAYGFKRKLFLLLEDPNASRVGKYWSLTVIVIILVSTASFIMESMPQFRHVNLDTCTLTSMTIEGCEPHPDPFFYRLEVWCIVVFTVDYLLRVSLVHTAEPRECGLQREEDHRSLNYSPLKVTVLYASQGLNVIDCLAIVPFYIELAGGGGGGASVLRVLRLIRIFRVLKMPKLRSLVDMFSNVVADAMPALFLLLFMTMLMCVLYASLIVFAEGSWFSVDHFHDAYPYGVYVRPSKTGYDIEVSPFRSILYAFWWFFTTATTVGYGDDFPTTTAGRCVGVLTFYTGIVLIALPITIVGGCFNNHYPDWVKQFGKNAGSDVQSAFDSESTEASEQLSPLASKENGVHAKAHDKAPSPPTHHQAPTTEPLEQMPPVLEDVVHGEIYWLKSDPPKLGSNDLHSMSTATDGAELRVQELA
eukprot:TRINITY_DN42022_c0_g1_i1.p1 TRINITY_DN42022_c0_g1~~TRINITY_DN42022_c0_g1_i1.p1  ORF type:complete len:919 (+),score=145.64 TRINITY_DN42022_c0_g1_i1:108-2864(+)